MGYGELSKRLGVAVVGIPVFFWMTLMGKVFFLALVDLIVVLAVCEFYLLAEKKGFSPSKLLGVLSVLTISLDFYFYNGRWILGILFAIIFCVLVVELFKAKNGTVVNSAVTIFGILYVSLFSSFLLIRELPLRLGLPYRMGGWIVVWVFATIWICDTAAYLIGSRLGKHKLFSRVSPNKTWEGTVGGFLVGIGTAVGLRYWFVPYFSVVDGVIVGVIVGVIGQLSDLVESMFKRDVGVKDTSSILTAHGGILDRFDSPLLVGPVVYSYLVLF